MKNGNNHEDTENCRTEKGREVQNLLSPCPLCVLRASVVKFFTVPETRGGGNDPAYLSAGVSGQSGEPSVYNLHSFVCIPDRIHSVCVHG